MSVLNNCLYKSSLKIYILDPSDLSNAKIKNVLIFFWNLPKNIAKIIKTKKFEENKKELIDHFGKKYQEILHIEKPIKGGDEIDDFDDEEDFNIDFDNIKEEDITYVSNTKMDKVDLEYVNYITDITIFPEDSYWTVKQKIYVATNIPIYRQHLFYMSQNVHKCAYTILVQDAEYAISRKKDKKEIMGMNVDYNLFYNKDFIKVRTEEPYTILDNIMSNELYLYDLDDFMANTNKAELFKDSISFNIIYYSLIKKYFPVMDDTMFRKYLEDEKILMGSYPILNIPKKQLEIKFNEENKILTYIYENSQKLFDKYYNHITVELIDVELKSNLASKEKLIIRNLLDLLKTSERYIIIDAYITHNKSKYRITKYWVGLEQSALNQLTKHKEEYYVQDFLVVYFAVGMDVHNLFIYADGTYSVKCMFYKSHDINFGNLFDKTQKYVQPIIDIVNKHSRYLFAKLPDYVKENVELSKIHAKIKWNKIYSDKEFVNFGQVLNNFYTAGILEKRSIHSKSNIYSTKIIKGMTKNNVKLYLKKGIESSDYYVIFKDFKTNETWNNRYAGENMNIINTSVNITFEIFGMDAIKFIRSINYIFGLMNDLNKSIKSAKNEEVKKSKKDENKSINKKFKEFDPKLYDMEDEKGTKYARIVQKKHRPINVFTEDEYKQLSDTEKKYIFQFINYTTGKPAYYKCSAKMPFLGFVVGKHPEGYCLPKCKFSETEGVKNKQVWNLCTQNFAVDKDELSTNTTNENILKFGKLLDVDKVGFCHESIYQTLDIERDVLLMFGYDQYFTNINGGQILDILCFQLRIKPKLLIDEIIKKLDKKTWLSFLSSNMEYEKIMVLIHSFRNNISISKLDMKDIFVEIAYSIFGVHIIFFETQILQFAELLNKNNSSIYIKFTDNAKNSVMSEKNINLSMLVKLYDIYFPIVHMTKEQDVKIFNTSTKFGARLANIIKRIDSFDTDPYKIFNYTKLSQKIDVKCKFIWRKYIQYVSNVSIDELYKNTNNAIVIGCTNSININDPKINEHFEFLKITKLQNKPDEAMQFLLKYFGETPIFITDKYLFAENENCNIFGCRIGPVFCWFKSVPKEYITKFYKHFNIEIISYDIENVNNVIINNTKPEKKYNIDLHETYYKIYIYKLFKYEFYKLLLIYRNLATHNKLVDKFTSGTLVAYLQNNMNEYPYSYKKIMQILKYNQNPVELLKTELILEDIIELRNLLLSKKIDEIKKNIENIVSGYITKIDKIQNHEVSNILYSQIKFKNLKIGENWTYEIEKIDNEETLFYADGKLKILESKLPKMIDLLIEDLQNYDMFRYEISSFQLMFIINYMNFRTYEDEKIIIQSL